MTDIDLMLKAVRIMKSAKNDLNLFESAVNYCNLVGNELIRRGADYYRLDYYWSLVRSA